MRRFVERIVGASRGGNLGERDGRIGFRSAPLSVILPTPFPCGSQAPFRGEKECQARAGGRAFLVS